MIFSVRPRCAHHDTLHYEPSSETDYQNKWICCYNSYLFLLWTPKDSKTWLSNAGNGADFFFSPKLYPLLSLQMDSVVTELTHIRKTYVIPIWCLCEWDMTSGVIQVITMGWNWVLKFSAWGSWGQGHGFTGFALINIPRILSKSPVNK